MSFIPLDNTIGAQLIGLIVSSIIYGITCLQVYLYYTEYSSTDGAFLRSCVAVIMLLDTVHLALLSHTAYYWTVTHFGDYVALLRIVWSLDVQTMVGITIFVVFELFFALRIYRLSNGRNWWIPMTMIILTCADYGCGLMFSIKGYILQDIAKIAQVIPWAWAAFAIRLTCDLTMTCSIIYYLNKNRTQFPRTNRVLTMLITYVLNTGLIVTISTLLTLILSITGRNNLVYAPFFYVSARLYTCCFMSTLNTRHVVQSALGGVTDVVALRSMGSGSTLRSLRRHDGPGVGAVPVLDIKEEGVTLV